MILGFIQNVGPLQFLISLPILVVIGIILHMLVGGIVGLIAFLIVGNKRGNANNRNNAQRGKSNNSGNGQLCNCGQDASTFGPANGFAEEGGNNDANVKLTCPYCGEVCEVGMPIVEGQHVRCPYCNEKFMYHQ